MHELSVCIGLLEQVERVARDHPGMTVSRIVIKLGPLSGIEPALLRHAYPLAAAGSAAEHAELAIDATGIVVHCGQCGKNSRVAPNRLLCSACGDFRTRIVSGDEMILESVELRLCDEVSATNSSHKDSAIKQGRGRSLRGRVADIKTSR